MSDIHQKQIDHWRRELARLERLQPGRPEWGDTLQRDILAARGALHDAEQAAARRQAEQDAAMAATAERADDEHAALEALQATPDGQQLAADLADLQAGWDARLSDVRQLQAALAAAIGELRSVDQRAAALAADTQRYGLTPVNTGLGHMASFVRALAALGVEYRL